MERFVDYWDAANVHLDGVVMKTVKDATAIVQALKTGGVDSIWQMSTRDADGVADDPNLELYTGAHHAVVQQLMIDNTQPPFDNPLARKALSFATDRDAINEIAFFGYFEAHWYDVPLPSNHPYFNADTPKAAYDLQQAKELFDAAGVTGDTTITYQAISTTNPEWVVVGEILQQSLAEIGLKVEIEKLDLSAWLDVFVPADQKEWPARIIERQRRSRRPVDLLQQLPERAAELQPLPAHGRAGADGYGRGDGRSGGAQESVLPGADADGGRSAVPVPVRPARALRKDDRPQGILRRVRLGAALRERLAPSVSDVPS
jgi:ABC-type transport system substrate-binding protein